MRCPKCGDNKNIKWLLRHQKSSEDDTSTNANVITIICSTCGANESVFLEDYLDDLFTEWSELGIKPFNR